jgi:hypothetical protein
MLKKLIVVAITVCLAALAGCSLVPGLAPLANATISPQTVQDADAAVDLAISSATAYIQLPVCSATVTGACRTVVASMALYNDILAAQTARTSMKALLRANKGGAIPVDNYNTAKTAFDTIETDIALYAGK